MSTNRRPRGTGAPIELLEDRDAAVQPARLFAHPGAEVIRRDDLGGTPTALQIADRFHL
jgi:hypothetical protein